METELQPLLTEDELARLLQMSTRSVRKARQGGALPHVRIGRLVRYRVDDVQEFVASAVVANDRQPTNNTTSQGSRGRIVGFLERQEQR